MDTAIIVGFDYHNTKGVATLGATIVDMYRIFKWCQTLNTKHIYIITDCEYATQYYKLEREMENFNCSNKSFIWHNVSTVKLFCNVISQIKCGTKSLIYYTGHGEDGIKLPSNEIIQFIHYRDIMLSCFRKQSQIIWILDCCTASSFPLAFRLDKRLFVDRDLQVLVHHDIIAFISGDGRSAAGDHYSYYTKYLLEELKRKKLSLIDIHDVTSKSLEERINIQCYIYSSHKRRPVLWTWIIDGECSISLGKMGLLL